MNPISSKRCIIIPVIYPMTMDGFTFEDSVLLDVGKQPEMVDLVEGYVADLYEALRDESTSKGCGFNNSDNDAIRRWADKKREQYTYLWVVKENNDNKIIGFAAAKPLNINGNIKTFFLSGGGSEQYRNRGYAKEISVSLLSYLKTELCATSITTSVKEWNVPSLKLHESLGFRRVGYWQPKIPNPEVKHIEFVYDL